MMNDKCRFCNGKMSQPKPVVEGPRKGQNRIFCMNCAHTVYLGQVVQQQAQPARSGVQWQQFAMR